MTNITVLGPLQQKGALVFERTQFWSSLVWMAEETSMLSDRSCYTNTWCHTCSPHLYSALRGSNGAGTAQIKSSFVAWVWLTQRMRLHLPLFGLFLFLDQLAGCLCNFSLSAEKLVRVSTHSSFVGSQWDVCVFFRSIRDFLVSKWCPPMTGLKEERGSEHDCCVCKVLTSIYCELSNAP